MRIQTLNKKALGKVRSSITSEMTMSSKSFVRKPKSPPRTPHSGNTSNKDINMKFQGLDLLYLIYSDACVRVCVSKPLVKAL